MAKCMFLNEWVSNGGKWVYGCLSKKHPGYNANNGGTAFGRDCSNACFNSGQECPVYNNELKESQNNGQYNRF